MLSLLFTMMKALAILTLIGISVECFVPATYTSLRASHLHLSSKPNELFDSQGWEAIREELDQVPVFACANEDGKPMKYSVELGTKGSDEKKTYEVPLFYTHVDDAIAERDNARKATPQLDIEVCPYQLGTIFQLWASNEAVIVPNKKAIVSAGAPPTANPMGQNVPLFACMDMAQENEDGKPVLPLFFELEDAQEALAQAVATDGGDVSEFEIVGLNLPEAVQLLSNANKKADATAFQFIPPSSSIKHIRDVLGGI
jgi:hypothetical protein